MKRFSLFVVTALLAGSLAFAQAGGTGGGTQTSTDAGQASGKKHPKGTKGTKDTGKKPKKDAHSDTGKTAPKK